MPSIIRLILPGRTTSFAGEKSFDVGVKAADALDQDVGALEIEGLIVGALLDESNQVEQVSERIGAGKRGVGHRSGVAL